MDVLSTGKNGSGLFKGPNLLRISTIAAFSLVLLLVLLAQEALLGTSATQGGAGAQGVVQEALKIVQHLTPPSMADIGKGSIYDGQIAELNKAWKPQDRIQCVAFVDLVYALSGNKLPDPTGNATDYWGHYTNNQQFGWTTIPVGTAGSPPLPGDIIAMSGGDQGYGHVAIVTAVQAPTATQNGSITVAQANWPGAQTMNIPLLANNYVNNKSNTLGNLQVQGFIRKTSLDAQGQNQAGNTFPTTIPTALLSQMPNSPYVQMAWKAALAYDYDPAFFLLQIKMESNFNPTLRSSNGRVGIAQLTVEEARNLGLNVYDPTSSDPKVDERLDPQKSLDAAARRVTNLYTKYLGDGTSPEDQITAYAEAIAVTDPKCGETCLNNAIKAAQSAAGTSDPNSWKYQFVSYLPAQTQATITAITNQGGGLSFLSNLPILSGSTRDKILQAARSQIGVHETGNNCNPFGPCEAWCALFASWTWRQGGVNFSTAASAAFYYYGQQHNTLHTGLSNPIPGDAIMFGSGPGASEHVGIIEQVFANGTVISIEGNYSNQVMRVGPYSPAARGAYAIASPA